MSTQLLLRSFLSYLAYTVYIPLGSLDPKNSKYFSGGATTVIYTLDYTLEQLMRCQDRISFDHSIKIIHMLNNDSPGCEDRYYVLIDCDPVTYTLLCLL